MILCPSSRCAANITQPNREWRLPTPSESSPGRTLGEPRRQRGVRHELPNNARGGYRPAVCAGQGPPTLPGGLELALVLFGTYIVLFGVAAVAKQLPSGRTVFTLAVLSIPVAAGYLMLGNAVIDGVYEQLPGRFIALCALAQGAAPYLAWMIVAPLTSGMRWSRVR